MTFVFVRHGESAANAGKWLAGHRDVRLTERGRQQAASLRGRYPGARVLTSDLRRAMDTAREAGWLATAHRELRERHLGAWEGCFIEPIRADGRIETLWSWDRRPPRGESQADVARRVVAFLAALPPFPVTVVVAHGGVLRAVLGLLDGVPREAIGKWRIPNVEVIERDVSADRWSELSIELGTR